MAGSDPVGGVVGLRRWASGSPEDEAAVDLVGSALGGRLCDPAWPWVQPCGRPGWYYLDSDRMRASDVSTVLRVAACLVDGVPVDSDLIEEAIWLSRHEQRAVRKALIKAGRPDPFGVSRRAA